MEKIKDFFKKNKATIVSVLSAILTFAIALSKIDMGAKVGIVVSILLVVIPFLIAVINGEDINTTVQLLVNAITVIQKIVQESKKKDNDNQIVGASIVEKELTEEEIKELITKGL